MDDINTDMHKFFDLYRSFGIELEAKADADGFYVEMEAETHEKINGYIGFCVITSFDKNGKFLHINIGE